MINVGDILDGRLSMNASGSAYLVSTELPKDIYIHKSNTNHALHLDNVKIDLLFKNYYFKVLRKEFFYGID